MSNAIGRLGTGVEHHPKLSALVGIAAVCSIAALALGGAALLDHERGAGRQSQAPVAVGQSAATGETSAHHGTMTLPPAATRTEEEAGAPRGYDLEVATAGLMNEESVEAAGGTAAGVSPLLSTAVGAGSDEAAPRGPDLEVAVVGPVTNTALAAAWTNDLDPLATGEGSGRIVGPEGPAVEEGTPASEGTLAGPNGYVPWEYTDDSDGAPRGHAG
jgi:hypothetical protein